MNPLNEEQNTVSAAMEFVPTAIKKSKSTKRETRASFLMVDPATVLTGIEESNSGQGADAQGLNAPKKRSKLRKAALLLMVVAVTVATASAVYMVVESSSTAEKQFFATPPCNPATQCAPLAIECVSCDPLDPDCPLGENYENYTTMLPGMCTDVKRPRFNNGVPDYTSFATLSVYHRMRRCQQVLTRKEGRDESLFHRYISACPENLWTCFDGYCHSNSQTCINRCGGAAHCVGHEVRYSKQRCDENCRMDAVDTCDNSTDDISLVLPVDTIDVENDTTTITSAPYNGGDECCPAIEDNDYFFTGVPDSVTSAFVQNYRIFQPSIPNPEQVSGFNVDVTFQESESTCCCNLYCTCSGDPHCVAFMRTYGSSYIDSGSFLMYGEGGIEVMLGLGARGVIEVVTVVIPGDPNQWQLNVSDAFLNRWQRIPPGGSPEYPPDDEVPSVFTEGFFSNEGDYATMNSSSPNFVPITHVELIIENIVSVKIILKRHTIGAFRRLQVDPDSYEILDTERLRFDVVITRFMQTREGDGCCPNPFDLIEENEAALAPLAGDGYCWQPHSDEIVNFFELQGFVNGARRLEEQQEEPEPLEMPRELQTLQDKCDEYIFLIVSNGLTADPEVMTECADDASDFGIDEIQAYIDDLYFLLGLCVGPIDIAQAPAYFNPLPNCSNGLIFEARPNGIVDPDDGWVFVRAYPSDRLYCYDQLSFDFTGTPVLADINQDGIDVAVNLSLHEVRFLEKLDLPSNCNLCNTLPAVENLAFNLLYGPITPTTITAEPTSEPTTLAPTGGPTTLAPTTGPTTSAPSATLSPTGSPVVTLAPTSSPEVVTVAPTQSPSCQDGLSIDFSGATVPINNLGGQCGRNTTDGVDCGPAVDPVLRFNNVGDYQGIPIDLVISNLTEFSYVDHEFPGLVGIVGLLHIEARTDTTLRFEFIPQSGPLINFPAIRLAFHDVKSTCLCSNCVECATNCADNAALELLQPLVGGSIVLESPTDFCFTDADDEVTIAGNPNYPRPSDPNSLTEDQLRVTATVRATNTNFFDLRLRSGDIPNKLPMTGYNSVEPCADTLSPTSAPSGTITCATSEVFNIDIENATLAINNLDGAGGIGGAQGPGVLPIIRYANVGTFNGEEYNLTIESLGTYLSPGGLDNAPAQVGAFARIGLGAPQQVRLSFTLTSESGTYPPDFAWYFSVVNVKETCVCTSCTDCASSCPGEFGVEVSSPAGYFSFLDPTTVLCNTGDQFTSPSTSLYIPPPVDPEALTAQELQNTIQFRIEGSNSMELILAAGLGTQIFFFTGRTNVDPCPDASTSLGVPTNAIPLPGMDSSALRYSPAGFLALALIAAAWTRFNV